MPAVHTLLHHLQVNLLRLTLALICLAALACVTATVLSALGVWPWITLYADLGGQPLPQAGMYAQIAVTVLSVMLACYLPANTRILALENSHRSFSIQMEDITRAYAAVHAADRQGSFAMASEFDEVKERISFLRSHPDLSSLEPGVLEVAAQMSQVSHELAETYSDANVSRARTFLTQRQQEIEQFTARLDDAKIVLHELQQWARDVDIEESVARSQLQRLREELFSLMPELSAQLQEDGSTGAPPSVVPISKPRPQD
jgi:hypothetical protein